jgi:hypothetical protein
LVNLLLHWDNLGLAEILSSLELLHVEGTQASVIESFRHDAKGVTHENLIDSVTREKISAGQLDVVPGVS